MGEFYGACTFRKKNSFQHLSLTILFHFPEKKDLGGGGMKTSINSQCTLNYFISTKIMSAYMPNQALSLQLLYI